MDMDLTSTQMSFKSRSKFTASFQDSCKFKMIWFSLTSAATVLTSKSIGFVLFQ